MTGLELKAIREAFGLSASAMGLALGYRGPRANIAVQLRRFERGARTIPLPIERLVLIRARRYPGGMVLEYCA